MHQQKKKKKHLNKQIKSHELRYVMEKIKQKTKERRKINVKSIVLFWALEQSISKYEFNFIILIYFVASTKFTNRSGYNLMHEWSSRDIYVDLSWNFSRHNEQMLVYKLLLP